MFDFIKNPFRQDRDDTESLEQAKADRIKFHRDHVRNGPVKFKSPTSGQQRRAHDRAIARNIKRTHKAQVRQFFADQRQASIVRGKLDVVGIGVADSQGDPYLVNRLFTQEKTVQAARWLITYFAHAEVGDTIEVNEKVMLDSFRDALNFARKASGLPEADLPQGYADTIAVA